MITVHVWDAAWFGYLPGGGEGSPGHASVQVGETYISFWPKEKIGDGHATHTLDQDVAHYRADRGQAGEQKSHWMCNLPSTSDGVAGLSERSMIDRWAEIDRPNVNYTASFQCSAVVNELLIAGGCRKFVPPCPWNWTSWVLVAVSPSDVRDYVAVLRNEIMRARKKTCGPIRG